MLAVLAHYQFQGILVLLKSCSQFFVFLLQGSDMPKNQCYHECYIECYIKSSPKSNFVQCKQILGSSWLIPSESLHTSARHANSTAPWLYLLPSTFSHKNCDVEFIFVPFLKFNKIQGIFKKWISYVIVKIYYYWLTCYQRHQAPTHW